MRRNHAPYNSQIVESWCLFEMGLNEIRHGLEHSARHVKAPFAPQGVKACTLLELRRGKEAIAGEGGALESGVASEDGALEPGVAGEGGALEIGIAGEGGAFEVGAAGGNVRSFV
jgi:hypothetical protein